MRIISKIVLISFLFLNLARAQDRHYFSHGAIALQSGIWKPSSIDDNPSKPFTNVKGADPFLGVTLVTPSIKSLSLQISLVGWQQRRAEHDWAFKSLALYLLEVDIKQQLVYQTTISPYVTYGMSAIWARQIPASAINSDAKLSHAGYSLNVGAGIDIQIFQHWGLSAEYQYLYAAFRDKIGLTDNYSGPKLTLKLLFIF